MLHRISGSHGIADRNPTVLVPMPVKASLRPSDFTGDASRFGRRVISERGRIRRKNRGATQMWASRMPSVSDSKVWAPNSGKHERAMDALAAGWNSGVVTDLDSFDRRTRQRIIARARELSS